MFIALTWRCEVKPITGYRKRFQRYRDKPSWGVRGHLRTPIQAKAAVAANPLCQQWKCRKRCHEFGSLSFTLLFSFKQRRTSGCPCVCDYAVCFCLFNIIVAVGSREKLASDFCAFAVTRFWSEKADQLLKCYKMCQLLKRQGLKSWVRLLFSYVILGILSINRYLRKV